MHRPIIKFAADLGPLLIFFIIYFNNENDLKEAIPPFIIATFSVLSQEVYNPISLPNTYQNADNPNYWKNKMPHAAYWQQDVHYTIRAKIDEVTDIITATETLVYTNNSPDDLDVVYFHLYQNAFQPDSYLDELQSQNGKNPQYGKYENKKLGTVIDLITVEGEDVKTELDNTILKVYLPSTLKPNSSVTFDIEFS